MMLNSLALRFDATYVDFTDLLAQVRVSKARKHIHKLRVRVKQLRAQSRVMRRLGLKHAGWRGFSAELSRLFDTAGRVREIQVTLQLVSSLDRYGEFRTYLMCEKKLAAKKLDQELNSLDFAGLDARASLLARRLERFGDRRVNTAADNVLGHLLAKVVKLSPGRGIQGMHKIRKQLRGCMEVLKLITTLNHSSGLEAYLGRTRNLNRKLGYWHDRVVSASYLQRFLRSARPVRRAYYASMYRKISDGNRQLLKTLKGDIAGYLDICRGSLQGAGSNGGPGYQLAGESN